MRERRKYYFTHNGQTFGPLTSKQLKKCAAAGNLLPTDKVWFTVATGEFQARQIVGLFERTPLISALADVPPNNGNGELPTESNVTGASSEERNIPTRQSCRVGRRIESDGSASFPA